MNEGEKLHRFMSGLKDRLRIWVISSLPRTTEEAIRVSKQMDGLEALRKQVID